jgi:hypothetical protein
MIHGRTTATATLLTLGDIGSHYEAGEDEKGEVPEKLWKCLARSGIESVSRIRPAKTGPHSDRPVKTGPTEMD